MQRYTVFFITVNALLDSVVNDEEKIYFKSRREN